MQNLSPQRVLLISVAIVIFFAVWTTVDVPPLAVLRHWAEETGQWFPLVFWLLYVAITQFPVPRTIMTVSSGILFGSVLGILLAITATTVSAVLSLVTVRALLREWIAPKLTHPAVGLINDRLATRGWLAVASLRMIAFVPFSIMNYAAALTRVRVLPFAVATLAGSLPGTIITVLFGDTLTGQANPAVVVATIILGVVGVAGLIMEAHLPAPQHDPKSS